MTFSQGRYKTRIKKLSLERPEECQVVAENQDGSICAHISVSWVKISPPREMTEKQLEQARKNIMKAQTAGGNLR